MKTGLVLGKFLPPHTGHLYVIMHAKAAVDFLIVVVGSLPSETIPPELRVEWLRQMVPTNTSVIHIPDDNPPGCTNKEQRFFDIWAKNLLVHLPYKPDFIFGSESYIEPLATAMDIKAMMVDQERKVVPITATMIRQDPKRYWIFIPPIVKEYYAQKDNRLPRPAPRGHS